MEDRNPRARHWNTVGIHRAYSTRRLLVNFEAPCSFFWSPLLLGTWEGPPMSSLPSNTRWWAQDRHTHAVVAGEGEGDPSGGATGRGRRLGREKLSGTLSSGELDGGAMTSVRSLDDMTSSFLQNLEQMASHLVTGDVQHIQCWGLTNVEHTNRRCVLGMVLMVNHTSIPLSIHVVLKTSGQDYSTYSPSLSAGYPPLALHRWCFGCLIYSHIILQRPGRGNKQRDTL